MENIQEHIDVQSVAPQPAVAYLDLVKKLREPTEPTEPKEPTKPESKPKIRGLKNVSILQNKSNTKHQNQIYSEPRLSRLSRLPRLPRLSSEDYLQRLIGCQTLFMNELKLYLKEEIKTNEKETNTTDKSKLKSKPSKVQMTNLEQIQCGSRSINIIRVINSRVEPQKMIYFVNLLKNRQMNFVEHLSEFMNKYNIRTTYKSLNTILLHSPYIMV